jgi:uncharacterized protein
MMNNREQANPAGENVNLVQRLYGAFASHDFETMLAMLNSDVVWKEPENPLNPAAGTRHGHAGFLEWLKIGKESEDIVILAPRQFISQGNSIAVVGYMKCRAKATGKEYESDFVHLVTVKDGKIALFQEFFDTYSAAEAYRPESSEKPKRVT